LTQKKPYNIRTQALCVIEVTAKLGGFGIVDIIAVFLSSALLFLFARSEKTIDKKEAIVMLVIFAIYYVFLLVEGY